MQGQTLAELLRQEPLQVEEAVDITRQVAEPLLEALLLPSSRHALQSPPPQGGQQETAGAHHRPTREAACSTGEAQRRGLAVDARPNRDGNYEIYVMNANGMGESDLANSPALDHWALLRE